MMFQLFAISLGASAVILLMLLLAPIAGKKFSAKWRYWVWLLLAARLLLPFQLAWSSPVIKVEVPHQLADVQQIPALEEVSLEVIPAIPENGESIAVETQPISPEITVEEKTVQLPSLLDVIWLIWLAGALGSCLW